VKSEQGMKICKNGKRASTAGMKMAVMGYNREVEFVKGRWPQGGNIPGILYYLSERLRVSLRAGIQQPRFKLSPSQKRTPGNNYLYQP